MTLHTALQKLRHSINRKRHSYLILTDKLEGVCCDELGKKSSAHDIMTPHLYASPGHFDGLKQDCIISIANTLEILQSCTKPLIYLFVKQNNVLPKDLVKSKTHLLKWLYRTELWKAPLEAPVKFQGNQNLLNLVLWRPDFAISGPLFIKQ